MVAPLEGIRVVEVASWLAVPCCASLLADMGAEVVKIEPPGGETYRRLFDALVGEGEVAPNYEFDNRGKRGMCVDLEQEEGAGLVRELVRGADIFLTNLTWPRLTRYGLTDKDLHAVEPALVYAVLSGFGTDGPDAERQAFDQSSFWARSGAMSVTGDLEEGPFVCRGGYGDRTTGLNLLSAILAALRVRDRTEAGQYVEVTLQRTGIWSLASDVNNALYAREQPAKTSRNLPPSPIWNTYEVADGRWLVLIMPAGMPYWPRFCDFVGRPEWIEDERFQSLLGLAEHGPSIVPEIQAMFREKTLEEWRPLLDASGLIWEPVAELPEVVEDPALRERGAFAMVEHPTAGIVEIINTPFEIRGADVAVRGRAPAAGEHTREVLEQAGYSAERIDALLERRVVAQR